MAQKWNIRPRGHHCQDCRKPFEEGALCHSSLREIRSPDEVPVLERVDRCEACRTEAEADGAPAIAWQSAYHAPDPSAPDPAPRQTVEMLLRRLLENEESASHQPAIYILAVMLERKKLLIERDVRTQEDGTLLRVYEHRKTGEILLVTDPGLRFGELGSVQEQIALLLSEPDAPAGGGSGQADQQDAGEDHPDARHPGPGERPLDPEH